MKPQEDIGSLVKQKLDAMQDTTHEGLWDKISTSLDERRKKRRVIYFFSSLGVIVLLFLTVNLVIDSDAGLTRELPPITKASENNSEDSNTPVEDAEMTPIKNDTIRYDYSIVNTENSSSNSSSKNTETESSKNDGTAEVFEKEAKSTTKSVEKSMKAQKSAQKARQVIGKDKSIGSFDSLTEGSDVKTTYYYYRGEDNSQVVTSDKTVIDSLLTQPKELMEKVNDSLQ